MQVFQYTMATHYYHTALKLGMFSSKLLSTVKLNTLNIFQYTWCMLCVRLCNAKTVQVIYFLAFYCEQIHILAIQNIHFNPIAYKRGKAEYGGDFLIPQHKYLYLVCKPRIFRAFSKCTPLLTLSFTQLSLCI